MGYLWLALLLVALVLLGRFNSRHIRSSAQELLKHIVNPSK
jgi:hypothetical protein